MKPIIIENNRPFYVVEECEDDDGNFLFLPEPIVAWKIEEAESNEPYAIPITLIGGGLVYPHFVYDGETDYWTHEHYGSGKGWEEMKKRFKELREQEKQKNTKGK